MRNLLRLGALLWVLVLVGVGAVLVQARRPLTMPDAPVRCEMPCFLGIVPGQTSNEDAYRLLQNHPAVVDLAEGVGSFSGVIQWRYTDPPPAFLSNAEHSELIYSRRTGLVTDLRARADIPLWVLVHEAAYGGADSRRARSYGTFNLMRVDWYAGDYNVTAIGRLDCPNSALEMWQTSLTELQFRTVTYTENDPRRDGFAWSVCEGR